MTMTFINYSAVLPVGEEFKLKTNHGVDGFTFFHKTEDHFYVRYEMGTDWAWGISMLASCDDSYSIDFSQAHHNHQIDEEKMKSAIINAFHQVVAFHQATAEEACRLFFASNPYGSIAFLEDPEYLDEKDITPDELYDPRTMTQADKKMLFARIKSHKGRVVQNYVVEDWCGEGYDAEPDTYAYAFILVG